MNAVLMELEVQTQPRSSFLRPLLEFQPRQDHHPENKPLPAEQHFSESATQPRVPAAPPSLCPGHRVWPST